MTLLHVTLFLFIPLIAWLDRQRGMSKEIETIPKIIALVGLGLAIAALLGDYNASMLTIIAVSWAAYTYGFGEPLGRIVRGGLTNGLYEVWQVGPLRKWPYLAMLVRGLLVLPTALAANAIVLSAAMLYASLDTFALSTAAVVKLTIAFGLAFPLAPWIAVRSGRCGDAAWAMQEWIRGGLLGALLWVMALDGVL